MLLDAFGRPGAVAGGGVDGIELGTQLYITSTNTVFLFVAVCTAYGMVRRAQRGACYGVLLCVPCLPLCAPRACAAPAFRSPDTSAPPPRAQGACAVGQTPRLPLVADAADSQLRDGGSGF